MPISAGRDAIWLFLRSSHSRLGKLMNSDPGMLHIWFPSRYKCWRWWGTVSIDKPEACDAWPKAVEALTIWADEYTLTFSVLLFKTPSGTCFSSALLRHRVSGGQAAVWSLVPEEHIVMLRCLWYTDYGPVFPGFLSSSPLKIRNMSVCKRPLMNYWTGL